MIRFKNFNSTGIAPDGKLFAGDLVLFQDLVAALSDFTQIIDTSSVRLGDTGISFSKYGAGEAQLSAKLRTSGYVLATGGLSPGAFTTTTRDAIAAGSRPPWLVIRNTTTGQFEYNAGSDATPNWQPLVPVELVTNAISNAMMQDNSVGAAEITDGSVGAAEIAGALKPSVSAAAGTEALRALGTTGSTAAAGNDARLSDTRTPTDGTVTNAKVAAGAGIAYSKLALTASVQFADLDASLQAVINGKLSLTGGTMTGALVINNASGLNVNSLAALSDSQLSIQRGAGLPGASLTAFELDLQRTDFSKVRMWNSDTTTGVAAGILSIGHYNIELAQIGKPASGETSLTLYYHNGTLNVGLRRVTVGAADSGGSGFRQLLLPNS